MKLNIWCAIILFIIRCFISCQVWEPSLKMVYELIGYAGEAISVSTLCVFGYEKYFWKKLNFYHMPVLASHYEGSLSFTWDGEMGEREAVLDIKQTFLSIKVKFKTGESESDSINASIEDINGEPCLQYLYLNIPDPNLREVSSMHYGYAMFKVCDTNTLQGDYFTDRKTVGRIKVEAKKEH